MATENKEVRKFLRQQLRNKITPDNCLGVHGCSRHALLNLIETGVLKGIDSASEPHISDIRPNGGVYFTPFTEARTTSSVINDAEIYASTSARTEYFLEQTGFDYNFPDHYDAASALANYSVDTVYEEMMDYMQRQKWKRTDVEKIINDAHKHKGYILGIGAVPLQWIQIDPEEHEEGGIYSRIVVTGKEGLHYKYIWGLMPLGPEEKKFLKKENIASWWE